MSPSGLLLLLVIQSVICTDYLNVDTKREDYTSRELLRTLEAKRSVPEGVEDALNAAVDVAQDAGEVIVNQAQQLASTALPITTTMKSLTGVGGGEIDLHPQINDLLNQAHIMQNVLNKLGDMLHGVENQYHNNIHTILSHVQYYRAHRNNTTVPQKADQHNTINKDKRAKERPIFLPGEGPTGLLVSQTSSTIMKPLHGVGGGAIRVHPTINDLLNQAHIMHNVLNQLGSMLHSVEDQYDHQIHEILEHVNHYYNVRNATDILEMKAKLR